MQFQGTPEVPPHCLQVPRHIAESLLGVIWADAQDSAGSMWQLCGRAHTYSVEHGFRDRVAGCDGDGEGRSSPSQADTNDKASTECFQGSCGTRSEDEADEQPDDHEDVADVVADAREIGAQPQDVRCMQSAGATLHIQDAPGFQDLQPCAEDVLADWQTIKDIITTSKDQSKIPEEWVFGGHQKGVFSRGGLSDLMENHIAMANGGEERCRQGD